MALLESRTKSGDEIFTDDLFTSRELKNEFTGTVYKTYSFLSLLQLEKLNEAIAKQEELFIDQDTILSVYEGHTIFSLFLSKDTVFHQVLKEF